MIFINTITATISPAFERALSLFAQAQQPCSSSAFLGLPPWYKYLEGRRTGSECVPVFNSLSDVWLIVLAIIEILLRLGSMAAVVYVLYGSVRFITARGNPDKINSARNAIQDAIIGLFIMVAAIAIVNFIGGRFN